MSRYAHATLIHGRDDATALTVAGFCIGLVEHDRATAFRAFDMALALSPSSAFTYMFDSTLFGSMRLSAPWIGANAPRV